MVANVDFSSILSLNKVEGVNTEYIWLGIIWSAPFQREH